MACINMGWDLLSSKVKSCFVKRKKGSISIQDTDPIAQRWELLSGKTNWENLLDPLDYDLRRYLTHYGQIAQVFVAFNNNPTSKYRGTSMYSKKNVFERVGLVKGNPFKYNVTKYFYAATSATESNWMGFVAVATDEGKVALGRRDIAIAWRGSERDSEFLGDINLALVHAPKIFGDNAESLVHKGFYSIYTSLNEGSPFNSKTSARDQVLEEIQRLLEEYKGEEISITITGHSLGSALATLNAVDIIVNNINKEFPVTAFLFASPKVGDENFQKAFNTLKDVRILRVANATDPVPKLPILGFIDGNIKDWREYKDVGVELAIDSTQSEYLKKGVSPHNIDVYLHGIAGTQGTKGGFKLEFNFDISLVNKGADGLKDEYGVPASWWVEKNKGMTQLDDGSWSLVDHEEDDE